MVKEKDGPSWEECEAIFNQADVYAAQTRAVVASWGYDVKVQTREERDAAFKKLHEEINGPEDQGLLGKDATEERKWRADPLRKSMGLQASKPRNAPGKPTKTTGNAGDDSSDEEEGRSGLGKAKNSRRARATKGPTVKGREEEEVNAALITKSVVQDQDTVMADTDTKEGLGRSSLRDSEANAKKVQSWNQETHRALAEAQFGAAQQPSLELSEKDVAEEADLEDSVSQDALLRNSVHAMFEHQELSKTSKKRKFADSSDSHPGGEQPVNKLPKIIESEDVDEQDHKEEGGESSVAVPKSKSIRKKERRNRDRKPNKEEEVKPDSPAPADAEAMAKARQLARERLGSGSGSQPNTSSTKKSKKNIKKKSRTTSKNASFA